MLKETYLPLLHHRGVLFAVPVPVSVESPSALTNLPLPTVADARILHSLSILTEAHGRTNGPSFNDGNDDAAPFAGSDTTLCGCTDDMCGKRRSKRIRVHSMVPSLSVYSSFWFIASLYIGYWPQLIMHRISYWCWWCLGTQKPLVLLFICILTADEMYPHHTLYLYSCSFLHTLVLEAYCN